MVSDKECMNEVKKGDRFIIVFFFNRMYSVTCQQSACFLRVVFLRLALAVGL